MNRSTRSKNGHGMKPDWKNVAALSRFLTDKSLHCCLLFEPGLPILINPRNYIYFLKYLF